MQSYTHRPTASRKPRLFRTPTSSLSPFSADGSISFGFVFFFLFACPEQFNTAASSFLLTSIHLCACVVYFVKVATDVLMPRLNVYCIFAEGCGGGIGEGRGVSSRERRARSWGGQPSGKGFVTLMSALLIVRSKVRFSICGKTYWKEGRRPSGDPGLHRMQSAGLEMLFSVFWIWFAIF